MPGRVLHKRGRNPERIRSRLAADKQDRIKKLVQSLVKEPVTFGNKRDDFLLSFHKVLIAPPILGSTGVMMPKEELERFAPSSSYPPTGFI
jgi:hypothetical protein